MPDQTIIQIEPAVWVVTPYALAKFSHHTFEMASAYGREDRGSFVPKLYFFCVSTELGLKASILAPNCNSARKTLIKQLGHDLVEAVAVAKSECGVDLFTPEELEAVARINPFYRHKALEYFTSPMLGSMLRGYKDLPELETMQAVASKIQNHLGTHNHFIDCPTPSE